MPKPGSTTARGYGHQHQRTREEWRPLVQAGLVACWRCGNQIAPWTTWDLGHDDHDRSIYRGPEHRYKKHCPAGGNRRAGAIKGNKLRGKRAKALRAADRQW